MTPVADLRIGFRSARPLILLEGFRFQGSDAAPYNGFVLDLLGVSPGSLDVWASWDDGRQGQYPYRLEVASMTGGGATATRSGSGDGLVAAIALETSDVYRVSLVNAGSGIAREVRLVAQIAWP
ncbi:hypothetical protein BH20CHL6_BH20CHL6_18550 [soil metagenome]